MEMNKTEFIEKLKNCSPFGSNPSHITLGEFLDGLDEFNLEEITFECVYRNNRVYETSYTKERMKCFYDEPNWKEDKLHLWEIVKDDVECLVEEEENSKDRNYVYEVNSGCDVEIIKINDVYCQTEVTYGEE